jgi:hypothetical protein
VLTRRLALATLAFLALAPATTQAAFPGANGEIRVTVRDSATFDDTYNAVDPGTGDVSLVPGVPAGLYSQARSSADGRTIAYIDEPTGDVQAIRDGSSIGMIASCGPVLVGETQMLHTRRVDPGSGDPCAGATVQFGASVTEEPFGDQGVDSSSFSGTAAVADPDGGAFYFVENGDVMKVAGAGAST